MMNDARWSRSAQEAKPIALTADDDEFFRLALRSILTRHLDVQEVIETGSFDEALEKLAERSDVFLALFDLQMPGLESAMSLRVVRENFPEVRVAVVSSSQQRQDIIAALHAGVHGYVPKSLGAADLARALGLILQGTIFVPTSLAELTPDEEDASDMRAPPPFSVEKGVPPLTPRQQQVLELLVEGRSNKEIARTLKLGEGTVKIHMAALLRNLGVANRAAAAVVGARLRAAQASSRG
jgi:DNA-binding NarL/FixJ family response regulator